MKTVKLFLIACSTVVAISACAQKNIPASYLKKLPQSLKLDNSMRTYQMTTEHFNYDLKGNFMDKSRIEGKITYGLNGDSVMLNDVYTSKSKELDVAFPEGKQLKYMQGFKYDPKDDILSPEFFAAIPQAEIVERNLVWDMTGFDVFAYLFWNNLELNEEYGRTEINGDINLSGLGTFQNKDIKIKWIGITRMNDETCAIIKFTAMNNPLKIELGNMSMTGRSHYWGEVYVSLKDKQIEYANLKEDVITDVLLKGQQNNILGYTVRNINLTRIQ